MNHETDFKITEKKRTHWRRIVVYLLTICTLSTALPDSNGNMQLTHIGVWIFTTLSELLHHEEQHRFIEQMQSLTETQTNPYFLSRIEVIRSAIQAYEFDQPGELAYWQQDATYASDQQALLILLQSHHISGLVNSAHRDALMETMMNNLPDSMRLSYELPPIMAGTVLYERNANEQQIVDYYEAIKTDLELRAQNGGMTFLSESNVLLYFLERSQGNIAQALADMAGFLKYMIRGVAPTYDTSQVAWIITHIRDQIDSDFSFNWIPPLSILSDAERKLVINFIGILYHAYGIVGPLNSLTQSLLAAGVEENYENDQTDVAFYKKGIDFKTVQSLNMILSMMHNDYAKIAS